MIALVASTTGVVILVGIVATFVVEALRIKRARARATEPSEKS